MYLDRARRVSWIVVKRQRRVVEYNVVSVRVIAVDVLDLGCEWLKKATHLGSSFRSIARLSYVNPQSRIQQKD